MLALIGGNLHAGPFVQSQLSLVAVDPQILTGFLVDEARASLIVCNTDDQGSTVGFYHMGPGLKFRGDASSRIQLDADVILIDVGNVLPGPLDSLVVMKRDGAYVVDHVSGRLEKLLSFRSIYMNPVEDEMPIVDLVHDINGDDLDDLLVPDFDGYLFFQQVSDGVFAAPIHLNAPAQMDLTYRDFPFYRPREIYLADLNLDGLVDINVWNGDELMTYHQRSDGSFNTVSSTYVLAVKFDAVGLDGVSFELGGAQDQSDAIAKTLYKMVDLNNDGLVDMVTLAVKSKGVFSKSSIYEIYMGHRSSDGKIAFDSEPSSIISSDGIQFEMDEKDFDNDGKTDFVISSVEIGLGKILLALITGSITFDLRFYRMVDDQFADHANVTKEISASFSLSTGDVFFPSVLIVDVSGDGRMDLLVQDGFDKIKLYRGIDGKGLFARKAEVVHVDMPNNPERVTITDLNKDNRQDIIIHYDEKHETLSRVVTVLVAD